MNAQEARDYLESAAQTETGRQALRDLGFAAVIEAPTQGDDQSSVAVAERLHAELHRRGYGL
jgi:hypothetical protein